MGFNAVLKVAEKLQKYLKRAEWWRFFPIFAKNTRGKKNIYRRKLQKVPVPFRSQVLSTPEHGARDLALARHVRLIHLTN